MPEGFVERFQRILAARVKSRHDLGLLGEELIKVVLEQHGYSVTYTDFGAGPDLYASKDSQRLGVEVKTARPDDERRWQFCFRRVAANGKVKTDVAHSDLIVLLPVTASGVRDIFLLRPDDAGTRWKATVSSNPATYGGWLANFRFNLADLPAQIAA